MPGCNRRGATGSAEMTMTSVSSVDGPFRIVLREVVAKRDADNGSTWYELKLDIHWEPRFPVFRLGNLTITVAPDGQVSIRLPKPLEHLANAARGRFVLSGRAVFAHRGQEWAQRITGGNSVSYTITRRPGRAGR